MRGTSVSLLGASLALVLLATGCSADAQERKHSVDAGPLSALTPGVRRFDSPGATSLVTFGAISLCSNDPAARIVLDAVRYLAEPAPMVVVPWVRTVPYVGERARGRSLGWRPLLVVGGYPARELDGGPWRGGFAKGVDGAVVDQTCLGAGDLQSRRIELLTALRVGAQGTAVKKIYLDYHVDDADYTLVVPGQQLVCGTKVTAGC